MIGRSSYGKGSAQQVIALDNGGAIRITNAFWYTPVGRTISRPHHAANADSTLTDSQRPRWPSPIVALGNFDGLHRGHQRILDRVKRSAAEHGGTSVALTFEPHPPRVLRPDKAPKLLMTLDQKLEAFERAGLHSVAIVRFTPDLARWEPELFVETVLVDWLGVREVWVGANFLFGRDRAGTYTLLKALGEDRGFRADKIDPVFYRDFVVSSTRVRRLVSEGRVDEATLGVRHGHAHGCGTSGVERSARGTGSPGRQPGGITT